MPTVLDPRCRASCDESSLSPAASLQKACRKLLQWFPAAAPSAGGCFSKQADGQKIRAVPIFVHCPLNDVDVELPLYSQAGENAIFSEETAEAVEAIRVDSPVCTRKRKRRVLSTFENFDIIRSNIAVYVPHKTFHALGADHQRMIRESMRSDGTPKFLLEPPPNTLGQHDLQNYVHAWEERVVNLLVDKGLAYTDWVDRGLPASGSSRDDKFRLKYCCGQAQGCKNGDDSGNPHPLRCAQKARCPNLALFWCKRRNRLNRKAKDSAAEKTTMCRGIGVEGEKNGVCGISMCGLCMLSRAMKSCDVRFQDFPESTGSGKACFTMQASENIEKNGCVDENGEVRMHLHPTMTEDNFMEMGPLIVKYMCDGSALTGDTPWDGPTKPVYCIRCTQNGSRQARKCAALMMATDRVAPGRPSSTPETLLAQFTGYASIPWEEMYGASDMKYVLELYAEHFAAWLRGGAPHECLVGIIGKTESHRVVSRNILSNFIRKNAALVPEALARAVG